MPITLFSILTFPILQFYGTCQSRHFLPSVSISGHVGFRILPFWRLCRFFPSTISQISSYSFTPLAVFLFSIVSIFGPVGFNILPFDGALPGLPFYRYYHFSALFTLAILPRISISGPSGFNIFTILAPVPFYHLYQFSALSVLTLLPFPAPYWFYHFPFTHFTALSRLSALSFSWMCQFEALSVLTFLSFPFPTGCTVLPFLPILHFSTLVGIGIFTIRIDFWPCRR